MGGLCRAARDRCVLGLLVFPLPSGRKAVSQLPDCPADLPTPLLRCCVQWRGGQTRDMGLASASCPATPTTAEGRPRGRPSPQSQPCHPAGVPAPREVEGCVFCHLLWSWPRAARPGRRPWTRRAEQGLGGGFLPGPCDVVRGDEGPGCRGNGAQELRKE